jgi:hypothetical protein
MHYYPVQFDNETPCLESGGAKARRYAQPGDL